MVTIPEGQNIQIPFPGFNFYVAFEAKPGKRFRPTAGAKPEMVGAFSDVSGLEATIEPRTIKEGGRNYGVVQRAGPASFATVVLKRGIVEGRHLWDWWALFAGADGARNGGWAPENRCDVAISLLKGRQAAMTWRLKNAMPTKFRAGDLNARGTDVAVEEIHLVHEGLHMGGRP